jgi:hypothetical protein
VSRLSPAATAKSSTAMAKDEEAGISNGPSQPPYSSSLSPAKKIELHPAFYVAYEISTQLRG